MPTCLTHPRANGERVLADLNALRAIGAYKTGVHKPTFSEPHRQSLGLAGAKLPEAGLPRRSTASAMSSAPVPSPDRNCSPDRISRARTMRAGSTARLASSTRWRPRASQRGSLASKARSKSPRGATRKVIRQLPRRALLCRAGERGRNRRRARPHRWPHHAPRAPTWGLPAGPRRCRAGRHVGYLEAHIEQGETLESGKLEIGVVTSIVGIWQYRINFAGEQNHAGTTRMAARKDAGLALAKFCVAVDERFPISADRARSGPPAASRSIPGRRASSRAARKCCSRSATTIRPSSRGSKQLLRTWRTKPMRKAPAP